MNLGLEDKKEKSAPVQPVDLSEDETRVLGALSAEGILSMDMLANMTGLPTSTIAGTLLLLELKKLLVKRADGTFEVRRS